jgi:hypothetical protein
MYPGLPFIDGLYTVEDLPDSIVITINSSEYTLSKTGNTYPDAIYSGSGGGFVIEIYSGWRVYLNPGQEDEQFFDFNCLISNSFVPGEGATASVTKTEDQFADSYTITGVGVAERQSLCVWQYTPPPSPELESPWIIEYGYPGYEYKWTIRSTSIGIYPKANPQNSPAGTYGPGIVVS